jgi:hypothetical protein
MITLIVFLMNGNIFLLSGKKPHDDAQLITSGGVSPSCKGLREL